MKSQCFCLFILFCYAHTNWNWPTLCQLSRRLFASIKKGLITVHMEIFNYLGL